MSLEKELSKYGDEAAFTSTFLVPLLRRLGFSVVAPLPELNRNRMGNCYR